VTAGNSGLQYDSEDVIYAYVWKTQEDWSGTCRQLNVRLTDGSNHTALFQFRYLERHGRCVKAIHAYQLALWRGAMRQKRPVGARRSVCPETLREPDDE
jgi:hypothetical protein